MAKAGSDRGEYSGVRGAVLFDRGKAVPRSDSGLLLGLLGQFLAARRGACVRLTGHANQRESARGAEIMAQRRATAVADALKALGARENQVEVGSQGARIPVLMRDGRVETALSRRVEVHWIAERAQGGAKRSQGNARRSTGRARAA